MTFLLSTGYIGATCNCKVQTNKCRLISFDERQKIFNEFWSFDWNDKRSYVANLCQKHRKENDFGEFSRHTVVYHLPFGETFVKVCKVFFENTLGLGSECVRRMLRLRTSIPKTTATKDNLIKVTFTKWLTSLPKAPSHYCRQNTNKLYLTEEFESIQELFNAYKEYS
jgi:hypothetical protein